MALPAAFIRIFGVGKAAWKAWKKLTPAEQRAFKSLAAKSYTAAKRVKSKRKTNPGKNPGKIKTMRRRRTYRPRPATRRRKGASLKTTAKSVLIGVGVGSIVGGGILGAAGGWFMSGLPGAAGAFLAPQIRTMLSGLTSQVGGIGGATGATSY